MEGVRGAIREFQANASPARRHRAMLVRFIDPPSSPVPVVPAHSVRLMSTVRSSSPAFSNTTVRLKLSPSTSD